MEEPIRENSKPEIDEIVEALKSYVNTSADLYKMKATAKGAEIASSAIINIVIAVFVSMVFLFASLALAFCLSEYFDKMYMGFLIVAGFYSLIAVVIYISRDKWLKGSLIDNIIKAIYSN